MRPAGYILIGTALAVPLLSAPTGYLPMVGPKPVVFGRIPIPAALAIAKLPPLARETPPNTDPSKHGGPVVLPPPSGPDRQAGGGGSGSGTNVVAAGGIADPGAGLSAGDPAHAPTNPVGVAIDPQRTPAIPGYGVMLPSDSSLPLLSPQMLVPFFLSPATTNRTGIIAPVQFTPAQPAPAASSTATYEQR